MHIASKRRKGRLRRGRDLGRRRRWRGHNITRRRRVRSLRFAGWGRGDSRSLLGGARTYLDVVEKHTIAGVWLGGSVQGDRMRVSRASWLPCDESARRGSATLLTRVWSWDGCRREGQRKI